MNGSELLIVIYLIKCLSRIQKRIHSEIKYTLVSLHRYIDKIIWSISSFLFIFLITINISIPIMRNQGELLISLPIPASSSTNGCTNDENDQMTLIFRNKHYPVSRVTLRSFSKLFLKLLPSNLYSYEMKISFNVWVHLKYLGTGRR